MLSRVRWSMSDKDQGFTLIELLVVIIIIGILAAIAIPVFLNQRKKAVDASLKSDLKNVALAMETYFADKRAYPQEGFVTGAGATAAEFTANGQTIRVTPGNNVKIHDTITHPTEVLPGTFCLWAQPVPPGDASSVTLFYDSDAGGVMKRGVGCT